MRAIKYASTACAFALVMALAGCSGAGTEASSSVGSSSTQAGGSQSAVAQVEAWEYTPLDEVHLENDAQTIYDSAADGTDAADYTPVIVLATQVVSGTNYAYLCETPDDEWHIVAVYQDTQKNDSIISDEAIDIEDVNTIDLDAEGGDEELVGAWEVIVPEGPSVLSEVSYFAFDAATTNISSVQNIDLTPVATLGQQTAQPGTNYRYLCVGVPEEDEDSDGSSSAAAEDASLYVLEVHATSDENASVTSLKFFDFLSYIDQ